MSETMPSETIIEMIEASQYHKQAHGIMFFSARLFTLDGKGSFQFSVWDNSRRPNVQGWTDPYGHATTQPLSALLRRRIVVLAQYPTGHELAFSATGLHSGQTLKLIYPDGQTSPAYVLAPWEHTALLVPA